MLQSITDELAHPTRPHERGEEKSRRHRFIISLIKYLSAKRHHLLGMRVYLDYHFCERVGEGGNLSVMALFVEVNHFGPCQPSLALGLQGALPAREVKPVPDRAPIAGSDALKEFNKCIALRDRLSLALNALPAPEQHRNAASAPPPSP